MGYCMKQENAQFFISAEKKNDALKAIQALANHVERDGNGGSSGGGKPRVWYSWVDTNSFKYARTLEDALHAWRWDIESDDDVNIVAIYFVGEKIVQDDILFNAIAPVS